jgi:hypothetical protein
VLWEAIRRPSLFASIFVFSWKAFIGGCLLLTCFADLRCSFVLSVSRILFTSMVEEEKMIEMG